MATRDGSEDSPLERFAGRWLRRRLLDDGLDWLRFRIDTFPRTGPLGKVSGVGYQPLPWLGLDRASRGIGTASRWQAMQPLLDTLQPRSALDVGANVGWFTLMLAASGIPTTGLESDPKSYRTALYAAKKAGLPNVGLLILRLDDENAHLLPHADCVLVLSVWHHFVRHLGLERTSTLMRALWAHAQRVLFFDTGEADVHPDIGLPEMTPDARTWLEQYLHSVCAGSAVRHLGVHEAVAPDGSLCGRHLFAVIRDS